MVPTKLSIVRMALAFVVLAAGLVGAESQQSDGSNPSAVGILADIEGPIGPATTRHIEKVIGRAEERAAAVVVLRLNTPGGLADSMRDIISEILGSPIPVIGYVAPSGAHAASAGTYILYATHLAAMAPGTNLGAATPVQIGGPSPTGSDPGGDAPEAGDAADEAADRDPQGDESKPLPWLAPDEAMTRKATNDAVALIRSLAEIHGRNADWAERAVREAASLPSAQALEQGVIDLVAADLDELLEAADGRSIVIGKSQMVLETRGLAIEHMETDAITRLLSVLSNPNLALILMMVGVYGLIFEFWNPGAVLPGVIGAISLTLGLYALNLLPLDYAGLALVGLGIAFMVTEAFTPTLGILGFGGLIAFVTGAAMLVDTDVPAYQISWWLIGTLAAISGAFLTLVLGYTIRVYRRRAASGQGRMVGSTGKVLDWSGGSGHVWVEGERWSAVGSSSLAPGMSVQVRDIDGLQLIVAATADNIPMSGSGDRNRHEEGG